MIFLLHRLLHVLTVVVVSTTLGFFVLHIVPGSPLQRSTEQAGRSAAGRAALAARNGDDKPLVEQYARFVKHAVTGDLGISLSGRPVRQEVGAALRSSLVLSGTALLLAVGIGMSVGALQGWRPHSVVGRTLGKTLTALYVVPEFIVAIVLLFVCSVKFGLLPLRDEVDYGMSTLAQQLSSRAQHLLLPSLTLAIGWAAAVARQQRSALREISGGQFIRTARAKGASEGRVFLHHALPRALPPVVVVIGLMLPMLVGGTVVVERVFVWPGLGSLLLDSIAARDYALMSGAIMLTGAVVALGTLATDAVLVVLNPRLRTGAA